MSLIKTSSVFSEFCKINSIRCRKIFHLNRVCCSKRYFSSKKHSLELLPEVVELLDSGSIKHRKHPGVRKSLPIQLPSNLVDGVNRLIFDESEKTLQKEAGELLACLSSRRLPLEKEEINMRIKNHFPQLDGDILEMPKTIMKEDLNLLRKEIHREQNRWKAIEYNYDQCLAYMLARLDANYASILKVFNEIKSQLPEFQPKTFFDFGSGIGSAVWAAHALWDESLKEYFCVDSSQDMNNVAEALLTDENTKEAILKTVYFRQFLPASDTVKYDLVVSAFSLLDLPSFEERLRVIDTLWRKTNDILVIIEFGNFAGFFSVLDARDYILQLESQSSESNSPGAHIIAPCPHEYPCPMLQEGTKRSCGTHVLYETLFPRNRQIIKKDWISYVVLKKGPKPTDSVSWPRLVKPVLKKSKHVYCRACCSDGKINEVIVTKSRHGRHAYRCTRSSTIGDHLPVNIQASTEGENIIPSLEEECKDE